MKKRNPISFSIWLVPDEPVKSVIKDRIILLSKIYNSPKFIPHLTLLSGFLGKEKSLIEKTNFLSKKISSFKIKFEKLSSRSEFFRSLFIKVKMSKSLLKAHEISSETVDHNEEHFYPHMSLVYGDFSFSQKESMISKIGKIEEGFEAKYIYLAHNDEINLKWKIICRFSLVN